MSNPLMCHVVAGYPTLEACKQLIVGMDKIGVAAVEVQIPFSDPIADGETIMDANDVALANGMTTASSLQLIEDVRVGGVDTDIYIMSYLQKIQHFGLEAFCKKAAECRVEGFIIPDLPYDSPEYEALRNLAAGYDLQIVPVLSPGMSVNRLQNILNLNPQTLYITSTQGITGNSYQPAKQLKELVETIKKKSIATIMIGFGVASPSDVRDVLAIGDIAVIGSAVIKQVQAGGVQAALSFIESLASKS